MSETFPGSNAADESSNPFLGPVNTVMQNIFDAIPDTEAEQDSAEEYVDGASVENVGDEGTEAAANTPAESDVYGDAEGADTSDEAAPVVPASGTTGFEKPPVTQQTQQIVQQLGNLSNRLEERFVEQYQESAIEQAQVDYPHYIEKLEMHPLELVGVELPPIDGRDENIILRTPAEVKDWQDAVRTILQREIRTAVQTSREEYDTVLNTLHSSIELFQNNPDLVPNTPTFNKELADRFVELAQPYALTLNGKLAGYSIPVQGLVDQVRQQIARNAPAKPVAQPAKKAARSRPQGGIPSKAGASGADEEDFSPMWKALGIDNMPV